MTSININGVKSILNIKDVIVVMESNGKVQIKGKKKKHEHVENIIQAARVPGI